MAGLLFNKYKGDKVRVLVVRALKEMLQALGEKMMQVKQGLLSVIFQGYGHMARQCTQPKMPRNFAWFKEKMLLVQTQESGQVLDEEQLAFLADP
ncbi:hypothetical protein Tco_1445474 [Tanacetum coccineum]